MHLSTNALQKCAMHACQYLTTVVVLNMQFSVCVHVCACVCQAHDLDINHLYDDDTLDLNEPVRKRVPSIHSCMWCRVV